MRDLDRLRDERFDLLVIGAGAFGAFAAWDAALKGLRVALIDAGDYCGGVSSRCFRIVHGGIRYLQHFDIDRVRRSARERAILLETAPHMVEPLPILVPTYGLGRNSRWFLGTGSLVYDALTWDRNRLARPKDPLDGMLLERQLTSPVRWTAAARMNMESTVTVARFEKPLNPSSGLSTPASSRSASSSRTAG